MMGRDGSRADEAPAHLVTVAAFMAASVPVTNAEYGRFVAGTRRPEAPFIEGERFAAADLPVVGINWFDATSYCDWLSEQTGSKYRLPTEAEREFAALGGLSLVDWPWAGKNQEFVDWVNALDGPHVPGDACTNGYGLRCMAENVHEWCLDWYDPKFYVGSPAENPRNVTESKRRSARGGSWRHREKTTRINARSSLDPTFRYSDFGFRVFTDI